MSTSRERILETLEQYPGGLCDDCLSKLAEVRPRQQVNLIARAEAGAGILNRERRECGFCKDTKLVNTLIRGERTKVALPPAPQPALQPTTAPLPMDPGLELDGLRRGMIRILNRVEAPNKEGFSARVTRFRDEKKLPGHIASLMLTVNTMRNLIVYDGFKLDAALWVAIQAIWVVIHEWGRIDK